MKLFVTVFIILFTIYPKSDLKAQSPGNVFGLGYMGSLSWNAKLQHGLLLDCRLKGSQNHHLYLGFQSAQYSISEKWGYDIEATNMPDKDSLKGFEVNNKPGVSISTTAGWGRFWKLSDHVLLGINVSAKYSNAKQYMNAISENYGVSNSMPSVSNSYRIKSVKKIDKNLKQSGYYVNLGPALELKVFAGMRLRFCSSISWFYQKTSISATYFTQDIDSRFTVNKVIDYSNNKTVRKGFGFSFPLECYLYFEL